MVSAFLSRIMGLVRVKYIMWLFGRGMQADALNAAFYLPDMISYFLVGGAASITFVTILTRYRETGREAEGRALALRHSHHDVPCAGRGHRCWPRFLRRGTSIGGLTALTHKRPHSA